MKLFTLILFFTVLSANEFPLIQPISVERASHKNIPAQQVAPDSHKKPKEQTIKISQTTTNTKILHIKFLANSATIQKSTLPELEDFANYLMKNKGFQVVIYGYTDSSGDTDKNIYLSQQRAKSVTTFLESFGISSTRLTAIGMGKQNPIADNDTTQGRETNRRIEALIIE